MGWMDTLLECENSSYGCCYYHCTLKRGVLFRYLSSPSSSHPNTMPELDNWGIHNGQKLDLILVIDLSDSIISLYDRLLSSK